MVVDLAILNNIQSRKNGDNIKRIYKLIDVQSSNT